jgi:hypothetical protein
MRVVMEKPRFPERAQVHPGRDRICNVRTDATAVVSAGAGPPLRI